MRGFRIDAHGGPEALHWHDDLPDPKPRPGDALVRVRACALNHLDLWVRNGVPGHKYPLPLVPGSEIAGDLVAFNLTGVEPAEDWADWKVGDPVLLAPGLSCGLCPRCLAGEDPLCRQYGILGETRDGGYAELVAVPRRNLLPMPKGLSYAESAALPLAFLTAWHMLTSRARLQPFESVLVHAAGSGVSSAAIQIARLLKARIIVATASTLEKLERARALGATHTVNYMSEDFVRATKQATEGKGADVVIDHVGGEVFEKSVKALAWGGRIVLCGATAAPEATINLRAVFFKSLSILGSTMGSLGELKSLLRYVESGELRPVIYRTFPLADAAQAQEALAARSQFGKIVLVAD
ncbi:MAG: zinc-binding dehydrogenase [Acidobacteriota bacterium]